MLEKIIIFLFWALMSGCVFYGLVVLRGEIAYQQHMRILYAIHAYHKDCYSRLEIPVVMLHDTEEYRETAYRVWDWSDKGILPPEKYEIIKPFIKQ